MNVDDSAVPLAIRPLAPADLDVAERISDTAYGAVDTSFGYRSAAARARWLHRTGHLLAVDPGGCWVAETGGEVAGFAVSFRRDDTWFLASYAVRPDLQGEGIGRLLLEAAEGYGAGCPQAMLSASADPRAEARYLAAGFTLVPQWRFTGTPVVSDGPLAPGTPDLDALDRHVRGSGHGPDHAVLREQFRLVTTRGGYAYLDDDGTPAVLCAREEETARALLRHALSGGTGGVAHVTEANPWARAVAEEAGLVAVPSGSLAVRGMEPPAPYLHQGALL
jgi:GNAT superfamily N-acetyltransferase